MTARHTSAIWNVCPVCGCQIPRRHLMCAHHWHLVPQPLKGAVWNTHKRLAFAETDAAGALQRVRAYRDATDAAIDFVVSLEAQADPAPSETLSVPTTQPTPERPLA